MHGAGVHATSSPHVLTITATHWKWVMTDPNVLLAMQHGAHTEAQSRVGSTRASAGRSPTGGGCTDVGEEEEETVVDAASEQGVEDVLLSAVSAPPASFLCMLPVTSLASVFACVERLGVSVELREGCHIPRVRREVTSGDGLRNRWVVWKLAAEQPVHGGGDESATQDWFHRWLQQLNAFCASLSAPLVHMVSAEVFDQLYDPPPATAA